MHRDTAKAAEVRMLAGCQAGCVVPMAAFSYRVCCNSLSFGWPCYNLQAAAVLYVFCERWLQN
jgi:hypothetical protein